MTITDIDPTIPPSGDGCVECLAGDSWWFHLRRCADCGHIGCCDSSPLQHARAHASGPGHRLIRTFEPGENWYWDYVAEAFVHGPELIAPTHRPIEQAVPGPAGVPPADWQSLLRH